jgi:ubiquinone/menaquinone biosynthesis C-methylase UbiE
LTETPFTSFADWWAGRRIATSAAFYLPHLQPGMALLDCGCGPGAITIDFAEALAPTEVIGVDVDDRALDRARKAGAERGVSNVRFEHGDIYRLNFADASFDAVWTASTMQWLRRPRKAIAEIRRVLKPGGVYGSRDRATRGDLFGNSNPLVRLSWRLHYRLNARNGLSPTLSGNLRALLLQAGFKNVLTAGSYENYGNQEGARFASGLYRSSLESESFGGRMVDLGWITADKRADRIDAWNAWAADPRSFTPSPASKLWPGSRPRQRTEGSE